MSRRFAPPAVADQAAADAEVLHDDLGALRHALPRLVVGLSLAIFGVVYTLDNLGVLDAARLLRYWPALLVVFGLALIAAARRRSDTLYGVMWVGIGALLLLDRLHLLPVRVWDLWPLALVGVGVLLMRRATQPGNVRRRRARSALGAEGVRPAPAYEDEDDSSVIHALAIFSGVQRRTTSVAFRGGSLTAVMGGIEVDLTGAAIAAERAVLDCFAFWGGIEITVPPGWVVRGRVMPLMGGFGAKAHPPAPGEATGELVVTGWAIMGGIVVKQQRQE